jgi:hypothetical protein
MEAIWFSETSVDFQRTTRRHIPEGSILIAINVTYKLCVSVYFVYEGQITQPPTILSVFIFCILFR